MLFRRIAFKDNPVSLDIEQYARNIADECKCLRLPITLVAAAMMGKTAVDEWRTSLSSIKNADPSSPDTDLHQRLIRWSYDALPNSNIKNCFLYCAMYREKERICVEQLVQMWVAEGLVRSRQGSHLMDMAIGFSYVNLLLDRRLFQNAPLERSGELKSVREYLQQHIKVHVAIRRMAINIGEEEENCVFKACQELENFPEIQNENCKRISVQGNYIKNLPTEFTCPKLVSLFLTTTFISVVPSEFLVSLPSLKVLILAGKGSALSSILSSVGQLKQLEFLDIRGPEIRDLPEDICHLSALQFLDLSNCIRLRSLPSNIGELKNLKYLNLDDCDDLTVIPHEISQFTSLSTLDVQGVELSVEVES
jgi:disease resistance protein RPS2